MKTALRKQVFLGIRIDKQVVDALKAKAEEQRRPFVNLLRIILEDAAKQQSTTA